jgi:hypothetical protein
LIFLAFLLPLALYLAVLGLINRRPAPSLVSGVWDAIGLVFAASGFLFFGGPAILTSIDDSWRAYWLQGQPTASADANGPLWIIFAAVYFVLVVGGVAFLLYRRRQLTAIYHCDPAIVFQALADVCQQLNLSPVRSGNLFLFGMNVGRPGEARPASVEGIQGPHYLPGPRRDALTTQSSPAGASTIRDLAAQAAVLEVDPFHAFDHVTLRWDPSDSSLRQEIEPMLAEQLASIYQPPSALGSWFLLIGLVLLGVVIAGATMLIMIRILG